ncbi:MAG: hypothetical protein JW808_02405 [Victivallales bacterium]|nr:hypothetical protein [Victivallales bacterium]
MIRDSKSLIFLSFLAFALVGETMAQAVTYFENVDVFASVVYNPEFNPSNVKSVSIKKLLQWIQIDLEYTTVARFDKGTQDVAWLENVVIKYDVLLPDVPRKPRVVLSGKVDYWAIPLDGDKHYAQAFIHPHILKRYVPDLKLNRSSMKDLRILVTFELNESPVGHGFMKLRSSSTLAEIGGEVKRANALPSTLKVRDAIFNRNETPWGVINLSHYELIKRK